MRIRTAKKYTLNTLLSLFVICAVFLAAVYVFRCVVAEIALRALFSKAGFDPATFTVSEVSQQRLSIREFDGCMPRESLCAKAKKIDLHFRSILNWDAPQEGLAIEGGELRISSQNRDARTEPFPYVEILQHLTLYPYLRNFHKIALAGEMFFEEASENRKVKFKAESLCSDESCRAEVGLSHMMSPITVRISASEEQERGLSLLVQAFNHELVLGAMSLKQDTESATWFFGIETHQQGALQLVEFFNKVTSLTIMNPQQFKEEQAKPAEAFRDSMSVQVTIDPTAMNHPLEIAVGNYPLPNGGTLSLRGTGAVSSAGECVLKGDVSLPELGAPIAVERLAVTPGGDFAVTASLTDKAQSLNNIYSQIALGKLFDDLDGGEVALTYSATGKLPIRSPFTLQGEGRFHVSALQGSFKGYEVRGGKTSGDIRHGLQNLEIRNWKLKLEALKAGIDIGTVNAEVPELQYEFGREGGQSRYSGNLSRITGSIFGGQLKALDIKFSHQMQIYKFPVVLRAIDLKDVLALYGNGYATATGLIDGILPVQIDRKGVSIQAGKLVARAPGGDIRIGEELIAKLSRASGMEVAAKALKNYHFTELESGVQYQPDGQLELRLALKGRSPELNTSRPVHVNLTLEQNVLELLKSIQMVQTIEEKFGQ